MCAGRVRTEQFPLSAGAGGRGTGARMLAYVYVCVWVAVCARLHCAMNPLLFPECEAHTTERDSGLGGEPECLGSKSICCLCECKCASFWFFFLPLIR